MVNGKEGGITVNNRGYLTIEIARELTLQRFRGQIRVRMGQIINHVEETHCKGVGNQAPAGRNVYRACYPPGPKPQRGEMCIA